MSDIGSMVAELVAAGTPPELAARVVAQVFIAGVESVSLRGVSTGIPVDEVAEKRRAYDRARKRKSTGIPPDSTGIPRTSESASLSKEEKKEEIKEERGERKVVSRGQRLPDDWQPTPIDIAVAHEMIGQERSRTELEKFKDHWKQQPGSKGVKLDWNAAWRNWIRRAAEYGGTKNGNRSHNGARRSASADFFAGIAGVAADIAGHGPASGPASEEVPLGRVNIDG